MPIQIKIPAAGFIGRDGTALLVCEDVRNAEDVAEAILREIRRVREDKHDRLEFYDDGIYLDGERLEIRGYAERVLRQFELVDTVSEKDLAEKVWGDSFTQSITIFRTIVRLKQKTSLEITRHDGLFTITRPR